MKRVINALNDYACFEELLKNYNYDIVLSLVGIFGLLENKYGATQ